MKQFVTWIVALAVTPVVIGAAWSASSVAFFPWTDVNIDQGQTLFQKKCASCHSVDAGRQPSFGPSLHRIGAVAGERMKGITAEQYILESILQPNKFRVPGTTGVMPAGVAEGLNPSEVTSLVGFLMTQEGTLRPRTIVKMVSHVEPVSTDHTVEIDFAKAEFGRELFFNQGKCATCHVLKELPTADLEAPNLLNAGQHTSKYLRQALLEPNAVITAGYKPVTLTLNSGEVITGRLVKEKEDYLLILKQTQSGSQPIRVHGDEIDSDEEELYSLTTSPMPDNYREVLTNDQIEALVYFLSTLKYSTH